MCAAGILAIPPPASLARERPAVPVAPAPAVTSAPAVGAGAAVVRYSTGQHTTFALRADGHLTQSTRTATGWSTPQDLGAGFASPPAATYTSAQHRIELFAVGTDTALRVRSSVLGRWGSWQRIGTGIAGGLSAIRRGGELDVFGIGFDGRVYQVAYRAGRWLPARSMGAGFTGSTAVATEGGVIDVFATTATRRIMHNRYAAGRWSGWYFVGSSGGYSAVSAAYAAGLRVYGVSTNRRVYEIGRSGQGSWYAPRDLGGAWLGQVGAAGAADGVRLVANGTDGRLRHTAGAGTFAPWGSVPGAGYPQLTSSAADLAKQLLARWNRNLRGLPGVYADLQATAAGRAIANSDSCGRAVRLHPRLLTMLIAVTNRYQVLVNNMVTGHGCDSGMHPKGRAIDFNTIVDPVTGARTNWHSGTSGDHRTLGAAFLRVVAQHVTVSAGAGQRNCAGSAIAMPSNFLRFNDFCSHQHIDIRA